MKDKVIYLLTQKVSTKDDVKVLKYAHESMEAARNAFNREVAIFKSDGYEGAEQAMYDDETYVKVAKLTNKAGEVFRIRLEMITLYE